MTITQEDVQRLLDDTGQDPVLVLVEGTTRVVPASDVPAGALEIASREELVGQHGEQVSEHQRGEIAARLDTEVRQLGG